MPDKKISALPAATTPLAGTEVLPIVQGGTTDQVSVANLTAGRDVGVNKLNAADNVVIGTAGKGITTGGATALGFGVNNAVDAVTINTSSNVGVGTNSPSEKVQVHGLVAVSNLGSGQNAMGAIGAAHVDAVNGSLLLYSRTADAMTEKVRITYTGNVGVGTAAPTSGSMDNLAILNAGVFSTLRGSVASTSGVAVTIATSNQNHAIATYIVSCGISSGAPTVYSAVAIVSADNNVLRITNLQTASLMTLSVSGTDIKATQSSGGAANILFAVTRIA